MPTAHPSPAALSSRDGRYMPYGIMSSQLENIANESNDFLSLSTERQVKNKGRFLWQNIVTGTTRTTWIISSTILTNSIPGGVALKCLPPGATPCPR